MFGRSVEIRGNELVPYMHDYGFVLDAGYPTGRYEGWISEARANQAYNIANAISALLEAARFLAYASLAAQVGLGSYSIYDYIDYDFPFER